MKAQARDSYLAQSAWSAGKTVTISQNQPPTANAGPDQIVAAGAVVSLNGTGSDPDNGIASWQWTQTSGTSVILSGAATAQAHFTAPNFATGSTSLVFRLRTTDAGGLSATDSIIVTVQSADLDGDGVPNTQDAFPTDPNEWADANGNGIGDNADAAAQANHAPDAPVLAAPAANATVALTPLLRTAAFHDPDAGDSHASTRWQILQAADGLVVLDLTSMTQLTSLQIPRLVLDENTVYHWRAVFNDNHGSASAWSPAGTFATDFDVLDSNGNGIPDDQEVDGATDLDGNGVPDASQSDIKSMVLPDGMSKVGIKAGGSEGSVFVAAIESADEDGIDSDVDGDGIVDQIPFGMVNFKLIVPSPGDEAVVTVYFSEPVPAQGLWYKYDPIHQMWSDFSSQVVFSADRMSMTLTLRDGGEGDADGVENGIIIDPAGVAGVVLPSSSSGGSGDLVGGVVGGIGNIAGSVGDAATSQCFIASSEAAAGPTSLLTLLGLIALSALVSMKRAGRR